MAETNEPTNGEIAQALLACAGSVLVAYALSKPEKLALVQCLDAFECLEAQGCHAVRVVEVLHVAAQLEVSPARQAVPAPADRSALELIERALALLREEERAH